ncbi:DnaJ domain-containing protein [Nocardia higoensis]|uniref:DnaJ domain-containing protein n=1 Tax=Nocardia higoensis TaxID=228599 RepID=UPI0003064867|nr:DnaJ domain-containing protein [Nocardia higoensis]
MAFVNYYEILEIAQPSDDDTIKKAIRKQRKEWRNRTAHPKAETRALAEKMTQHISDAEAVLLDPAKRADYNRQLAAQVNAPERPQQGGGSGRNWLEITRQYLADGTPSRANYAAREATQNSPGDPEAWYLRGVTSSMLDNVADAEFELSEALRLDPNNASYHCELADLYASAEQWSRAQQSYQRASDLEPGNPYYQVGVATMHCAQERPDLALPTLEQSVAVNPQVELFRVHLAIALADNLTNQWSQFGDGSRSILNHAQLELSKTTLQRIKSLNVTDPELTEHLDEIDRVVGNADRVRWYSSDNLLVYAGGMLASLIAVFFLADPSTALVGLVGLAGLIGIPALFVKRHHVAGWVWDSRNAPAYAKKTGLQPTIAVS